MVPTESGRTVSIEMTDDETIKMFDVRGIKWKYGGDGRPVALDTSMNRYERRRARFGRTRRESK